MNVLVVTTFFPNSADWQRAVFVQNLVRAMQGRCKVSVVSPVPYAPPIGGSAKWKAQRDIPGRATVDGVDVVYPRFLVVPKVGWLSGFNYFLGILNTLRRWRRSLGVGGGEGFLVHAHCAYPDAVGVALAARLLRIPYVVTAHGSDINVYAEQRMLRPQVRWALRHAAGVIAVSRGIEEKIGRLTKLGPARLERIPCAGFDPRMFCPRERDDARDSIGLRDRRHVVLFVGQLVPVKGVEFLIEAWGGLKHRGAIGERDLLVLIGDGPERDKLERRIGTVGVVDTVRLAGALAHAEVANWVAAATLLCLPSHNEGTPNVIVEALACGIPVVASRVGGVPDLIQEGNNGLLVPPADAPVLSRALESAICRSWDAQKIRESVAHLTWRAIAEKNCKFLESIEDVHDPVH